MKNHGTSGASFCVKTERSDFRVIIIRRTGFQRFDKLNVKSRQSDNSVPQLRRYDPNKMENQTALDALF